MKIPFFKKHASQERFWDYSKKEWVKTIPPGCILIDCNGANIHPSLHKAHWFELDRRANGFIEMYNHPYYKRVVCKLKNDDKKFVERFIRENALLDDNAFSFKVNRLWLDQEKPKNHALMWEVLSVVGATPLETRYLKS